MPVPVPPPELLDVDVVPPSSVVVPLELPQAYAAVLRAKRSIPLIFFILLPSQESSQSKITQPFGRKGVLRPTASQADSPNWLFNDGTRSLRTRCFGAGREPSGRALREPLR